MGSSHFFPLPNAIPTAVKTASGVKTEDYSNLSPNRLAPRLDGKSFQSILAQAAASTPSPQQQVRIEFDELPKELQKIIRDQFGIQNTDEIELIQLPKHAVRIDENGELRISVEEAKNALQDKADSKSLQNSLIFQDPTQLDETDSQPKTAGNPVQNETTKNNRSSDYSEPATRNADLKNSSVFSLKDLISGEPRQDEINPTPSKNRRILSQSRQESDNAKPTGPLPNENPRTVPKAERPSFDAANIQLAHTPLQDQANGIEKETTTNRIDPNRFFFETPSGLHPAREADLPQDTSLTANAVHRTSLQQTESDINAQTIFNAIQNQQNESTEANKHALEQNAPHSKLVEPLIQSNSSQVIYFKPENGEDESKTGSLQLDEAFEVTGDHAEEIAEEIASFNRRHLIPNSPKDDTDAFLIAKSPIQPAELDQKPVLFFVNTKDIAADSESFNKQNISKSEAVAEKLSALDGQIKVLFANTENRSGNEDQQEDPQQQPFNPKNPKPTPKQNTIDKLPMLSESGLQLSRKLNEQAAEKTQPLKAAQQVNLPKQEAQAELKSSGIEKELLKPAIQSNIDQTALETKTPAQPAELRVQPENTQSTNTPTHSSTTAPQDSSSSSTQQPPATQSTPKPGAPPDIPQVYKDAATQQIVKSVQSSLGSERSHISIRLVPESLGRVDIQLKMENGMMTAHITAEKESTQTLLEKNSSMLKSALEEKQIHIDKVVIGKDTPEYRQPHQEQNKSSDRWREYQQDQHKEQNQSRRDQQEQQQEQPNRQNNTWRNITSYMDRFFALNSGITR